MIDRMLVGHQLENFVKSCTFGGLECAIDDGQVLSFHFFD